MLDCPPRSELMLWRTGEACRADGRRITAHLKQCSRCRLMVTAAGGVQQPFAGRESVEGGASWLRRWLR